MPINVAMDPSKILNLDQIYSIMPIPGVTMPPPVNTLGAVGGADSYARSDHTHISSVVKLVITTTDATGAISWTYPSGFFSVVPSVQMTVEVPSGQPMFALVNTNTITGGSGQIIRAQMLPATILTVNALVNFNVYAGTVPSGTKVHVWAGKPNPG